MSGQSRLDRRCLSRRNTQNLDIKGMPLVQVMDSGLRPNSIETFLLALTNFPFGDDQVNSTIFVVLTLCMSEVA
jgi:hypothetical protein